MPAVSRVWYATLLSLPTLHLGRNHIVLRRFVPVGIGLSAGKTKCPVLREVAAHLLKGKAIPARRGISMESSAMLTQAGIPPAGSPGVLSEDEDESGSEMNALLEGRTPSSRLGRIASQ